MGHKFIDGEMVCNQRGKAKEVDSMPETCPFCGCPTEPLTDV